MVANAARETSPTTEVSCNLKPAASRPAAVVLVSMPFGPLLTPSIALGLLGAKLKARGVTVSTLYMTIFFAKRISPDLYSSIAQGEPGNHLLLGEWLFRDALFGANSLENDEAFLALLKTAILASPHTSRKGRWRDFESFSRDIARVRAEVCQFIKFSADRILDHSPRIVGFTSVFQQHVASLAVAAEIKRRDPRVITVFGGANCEAAMGLETLRQFRQVDYVVSGEGDHVFPELVDSLLRGDRPGIPGVFHRGDRHSHMTAASVRDLDALPFPDYEEYFTQLRDCDLGVDSAEPRLLFETSRGCWWGEKQHCTFCGLNGTSMAFRSKSAARAFEELRWMTSTYPGHAVSVVDNILDMKYFRDFVPLLAETKLPIDLFYEVKANLKKGQLRLLKQANVNCIQPGIESLHDSILKLMRKGVSALQNVQLLKWCAEFEIDPHWNLIWGFPKEDPLAYVEMTSFIPLLRHLPPPNSTSSIRLDRFSPNFNEAANLGIRDVRPFPVYDFIYPFDAEAKANLAYYFTFQYSSEQDVDRYTSEFLKEIHRWQAGRDVYHFFSIAAGDRLSLWDFRDLGHEPLVVLTPLQSIIYSTCDAARTVPELCSLLGQLVRIEVGRVEMELQRMVDRKIMLRAGNKYLSLALSTEEHTPNALGLVAMQKYVSDISAGSSKKEETTIDLTRYVLN